MVCSFVQMHSRSHRSWEAIVARMSPEGRLAWSATGSAQVEAPNTISPRAAFHDAGVLMEMADFAERNAPGYDAARMRVAALQLRFAAVGAMVSRASFR